MGRIRLKNYFIAAPAGTGGPVRKGADDKYVAMVDDHILMIRSSVDEGALLFDSYGDFEICAAGIERHVVERKRLWVFSKPFLFSKAIEIENQTSILLLAKDFLN
jgi:hypothetical protein